MRRREGLACEGERLEEGAWRFGDTPDPARSKGTVGNRGGWAVSSGPDAVGGERESGPWSLLPSSGEEDPETLVARFGSNSDHSHLSLFSELGIPSSFLPLSPDRCLVSSCSVGVPSWFSKKVE